MAWRFLLAACGLAVTASVASAQPLAPKPDLAAEQRAQRERYDRALEAFTSRRLTRFSGDDELLAYLDAAGDAARSRRMYWAQRPVRYAALQTDTPTEPPCPEDQPDCLEAAAESSVTVTGSRIAAPSNPSITNNQMAGVDEGDIVKQIGKHLVVLQDGRLFVIDTQASGAGELALTDRRNVYRATGDVDWYDEMLVFGDRILVTAYSYRQRATELSVLRLDGQGRLHPEGVFYLSSDDYYSGTNYATRIVGDQMVVYTPFNLNRLSEQRDFKWPMVRRWVDGESADAIAARGRPLFEARGIYRPVRTTYAPVIHTVSFCPLSSLRAPDGLACRSTAFAGSAESEFYVSDDHAYLWTVPGWDERNGLNQDGGTPPACDARRDRRRDVRGGLPGVLFRVPVDGGAPDVIGTTGTLADQFAMEASGGRFKAVTLQEPIECVTASNGGDAPIAFLSLGLDAFSSTLVEAPAPAYTGLPSVGTRYITNRFSDDHVVYGAASRRRQSGTQRAYAVPVDRPSSPVRLDLPHTMIRAERAGPNIVLTGYDRAQRGLNISLVDLRGRPEIADTIQLDGRAESEGRSHAFNSRIERDGSGVMGLPTIAAGRDPRYPWRSEASDISFVKVSAGGVLGDVGRLESREPVDDGDEVGDPDYDCEVSCVDWYGNSRPIFTDGRIFALTGNELIEGRLRVGRVREQRRLDITRPVGTRSAR